MARKIEIQEDEWNKEENRFRYAHELEAGNILFFEKAPFYFAPEDIEFLLNQRQGGSKSRKNIAYKPQQDRITNHDTKDVEAGKRLKEVLRNYSASVTEFLSVLLSPYAKKWKHDYASFRPFQEKGRKLRLRARNDLLHVDAFPTRPLHGGRILRFFTNINPVDSRHWITSKSFEELVLEYGGEKGVLFPRSVGYSLKNRLQRKAIGMLRGAGIKLPLRSPYDHFMLNFHNYLKENGEFQKNCPKDHWQFPPGSCWAVFTDQVSHAALAGQYALEQTFLIPRSALLCPDLAPVSVLERLSRGNMVDPVLSASLFA